MEYKAYVLKDPETLELRYIGITRRTKLERLSQNLSNSANSDTTPSQTSIEEGVTTIEKQETELSRVGSSDSKREASKDEDIVCSTWRRVAAKAGKYLRNLLNI